MNVCVRSMAQLEAGEWYQVAGTTPAGLPLPTQVFYLGRKLPRETVLGEEMLEGVLYTRMWDQLFVYPNYVLYPQELQLKVDDTDCRLEKIDKVKAQALLEAPDGEHEMFRHRQLYGYR